MKFVCIHGHFYQPPRENPWLESIEPQDPAAPYHDWNERVTAECYQPNAAARILDDHGRIVDIVNNYASISFDFGPTLLAWLSWGAPSVYQAILAADRESRDRFAGHGSALAQVYNHVIMPLATEEEKELQIVWGIRDFEHRFGRRPEGMWLAETAVDLPTLELLAAHGIGFTILGPHQARRVRAIGASRWDDVSRGRVDSTRPYVQRLPSGASIGLFFYDASVSRAVAFEGLLHRGEQFAARLLGSVPSDGEPGLAHIATDGESYGHHHPHGDMALAYALGAIEEDPAAEIINYGLLLERFPPRHEVEIVENTSWSCGHGIDRWRGDCGCHTGGQPGWSQAWRKPLRESLDWLRDTIEPHYREKAASLYAVPQAALEDYGDVIRDRGRAEVQAFLERHRARELGPEEEVEALELLELKRQLQLMYTSCGWFFNDLSGIETVQVLRYAARAVQLAEGLFGESVEDGFLDRLEHARSNRPEKATGRNIYERTVKPSKVTWETLGAHYCIATLFHVQSDQSSFYCYQVEQEHHDDRQSGKMRLAAGRVRLTSRITWASAILTFAALHLGDHSVIAGVRRDGGDESYRKLVESLAEPFRTADTTAVLRGLDRSFERTYDLRSLFGDEQRRIIDVLLETTLEEAEAALRQLYEHHGATMRFLAELGVPSPRPLSVAAEVVLNRNLRRALTDESSDHQLVASLIEEAAAEGVDLDETSLAYTAERQLRAAAEEVFENTVEIEALARLHERIRLVRALPFEVDLSKVQNLYFRSMQELWWQKSSEPGAQDWLELFANLGRELSIRLPEEP